MNVELFVIYYITGEGAFSLNFLIKTTHTLVALVLVGTGTIFVSMLEKLSDALEDKGLCGKFCKFKKDRVYDKYSI